MLWKERRTEGPGGRVSVERRETGCADEDKGEEAERFKMKQ